MFNSLRHHAARSYRKISRRLSRPKFYRLVAGSALFDRQWYLATYPDVVKGELDPVRHYLMHGAAEGRDPGPGFSTNFYLASHRDVTNNPLVHYLTEGQSQKRLISAPGPKVNSAPMSRDRFEVTTPLRIHHLPGLKRRIVMITDGIDADRLYGGVATALIMSSLLARRFDASLCIVTRNDAAHPVNLKRILEANNIPAPRHVEFHFCPSGSAESLPVGDQDLYVTTSWWTTGSALRSLPASRILYLIQDDERIFYPNGDEQLQCAEVMAHPALRFIVNSKLLFDHFRMSGAANITKRGTWFEPAFPTRNYFMPKAKKSGRLNFIFYARPDTGRNLYHRGLAALDTAITRGILDPEEWNISFVGRQLQPVALPGGIIPTLFQNLAWQEYTALIREADLGLSLMYSPHPSYPPLDIAASGGVAVTNSFTGKRSLDRYSKNIICVEPDLDSLVAGLARGAELARDRKQRKQNYARSTFARDWGETFEKAQNWAAARFPHVR